MSPYRPLVVETPEQRLLREAHETIARLERQIAAHEAEMLDMLSRARRMHHEMVAAECAMRPRLFVFAVALVTGWLALNVLRFL